MRIQETSGISQLLEESRRLMDFPLAGSMHLPGPERELLKQLETQLIVPAL